MNLISIPYHDWRKIEQEGFRTRDSHLIKHFASNNDIEKIVVINRPTTYLEMILLKKKIKIEGEVIYKKDSLKLIKIHDKLYIIDYITKDILNLVLKRKLWFFNIFADECFISFCKECFSFLQIKDFNVISHNIFSVNLMSKLKDKSTVSIFDAYDNQIFFPRNKAIKQELGQAYHKFVDNTDFWITNSQENIDYYKENYNITKCFLIKNGVDLELFSKSYSIPIDLEKIPHPIIGFGGKISHIVDYNLINYITEKHSDKSFVFVGQVLDKTVFKKILKRSNVYYLGDKKYSKYPAYVKHFDLGIVPYVSEKLQHGGDSMKVYEYLAASLNVVGVPAGGMQDLTEYIYLANTKEEFSELIDKSLNEKNNLKPINRKYSWADKATTIINLINNFESSKL